MAIKLNDKERKMLEILAEEWSDEMNCFAFAYLSSKTGLERKEVRRACRSLARKGLAAYVNGLFNLEGEVAGAGYCATEAGAAFISPCDVCGDVATFDYILNSEGKLAADYEEENTLHILECEQHYKKSPKLNPTLV